MVGQDKYSRNKKPKKIQNNIILIVCGGETEEIYFSKFNIELGEIRIKPVLEATNPTKIVECAIREKSMNNYKMTWCVFDKDNFTDFDTAIDLATRNGIKVAFSNQAFEIWFIMHFQHCNGALNRSHYKACIEKNINIEYSKTDPNLYKIFKPRIKDAIEKARAGHEQHKVSGGQPSGWESCTTVYELVRELKRWQK